MIDFLAEQFDNRISYSSLKVYGSGIPSIHLPSEGRPIGECPVVSRALRGAFISPPQPKHQAFWDVEVGPLPPTKGYTHLLTCVDRFTRWPEAIPLINTSTETVAHAFLMGWIAWFGVPTTITIDQGGQFESHLWHQLMQLLGTHRIHTTAYHPCADGLVERLHRQLKASLMATCHKHTGLNHCL